MNSNGHANGHHKAVTGEAADALKTLMPSTDLSRGDVATLITQARNNISVFLDDRDRTLALIKVLEAVAKDEGSRQRVRASEVLLKAVSAAVDQSIKLAEFGDKVDRLNNGQTTENVGGITVVIEAATPPQLEGRHCP